MELGGNGQKVEFKHYIKIGMNDNGQFAMQTNIPTRIMGYGMLEEAKKAVEIHIQKVQAMNKPRVQPARF